MKLISTFSLIALFFLSACASNQEAMQAYYNAVAARTNSPMMILKGSDTEPAKIVGKEIRFYFPLDEVQQFHAAPSEILQGLQAVAPWLGAIGTAYALRGPSYKVEPVPTQVVSPVIVEQPPPVIVQP